MENEKRLTDQQLSTLNWACRGESLGGVLANFPTNASLLELLRGCEAEILDRRLNDDAKLRAVESERDSWKDSADHWTKECAAATAEAANAKECDHGQLQRRFDESMANVAKLAEQLAAIIKQRDEAQADLENAQRARDEYAAEAARLRQVESDEIKRLRDQVDALKLDAIQRAGQAPKHPGPCFAYHAQLLADLANAESARDAAHQDRVEMEGKLEGLQSQLVDAQERARRHTAECQEVTEAARIKAETQGFPTFRTNRLEALRREGARPKASDVIDGLKRERDDAREDAKNLRAALTEAALHLHDSRAEYAGAKEHIDKLLRDLGTARDKANYWEQQFRLMDKQRPYVADDLLKRMEELRSPPIIHLDKDSSVSFLGDRLLQHQEAIQKLGRVVDAFREARASWIHRNDAANLLRLLNEVRPVGKHSCEYRRTQDAADARGQICLQCGRDLSS